MSRTDAEITEYVLKKCETRFSEEFIKKLGTNSQTSRLSTKYEMIETALIEDWKSKGINYTEEQLQLCASKAYIYAKMITGKFTEIRPRVDSTEAINYIILTYEQGYKYMLEAIFMKLGINSLAGYVKGKLEGNKFFTKITEVTNSQTMEIKKKTNPNKIQISKIKNIIFEIRTKEDEFRWVESRTKIQNTKNKIQTNSYNLNYAQ